MYSRPILVLQGQAGGPREPIRVDPVASDVLIAGPSSDPLCPGDLANLVEAAFRCTKRRATSHRGREGPSEDQTMLGPHRRDMERIYQVSLTPASDGFRWLIGVSLSERGRRKC